jgi:hypothetical protein
VVILGLALLLSLAAVAAADPRASGGVLVFMTQQALRSPAHLARGLGVVFAVSALVAGLWAIGHNIRNILRRH